MQADSDGNDFLLLPMFYLGPLDYYCALISGKKNIIDVHENYIKQTNRNHCLIYGTNNVLRLTIPVHHIGKHIPVKEQKICNDHKWQHLHWRSLTSAYRSSPFFEYYEEELAPFYHKKFEFLCDFNEQLMQTVFSFLGTSPSYSFSTVYTEKPPGIDMRSSFSDHTAYNFPRYSQVFEDKLGFIPNLSIADLLFNLGNEAISYLRQVITNSY